MKKEKAAASDSGISTAEEAPVLVDEVPASEEASSASEHFIQDMGWNRRLYGAWNFGTTRDVPAEPNTAVEEAVLAEGPCSAVSEEALNMDEPYNIVPEDTFPMREAVSNENSMERENVALDATLEGSQAEVSIEDFDDAEEHSLNQHDNIPYELNDPYEVTSGLDVASTHNAPAEDAEFLVPPSRPALSAVHDDSNFHPPPLATSSTVTSVLKAAAQGTPTEDSHTITLKVLNGSKVLRSVVFIKNCTRTAILNETRAYCMKCAQNDQHLGLLLAKEYDLALMSLKIYGYDMDLSSYKVENLSSLICAVEKTSIPCFTLRIAEL